MVVEVYVRPVPNRFAELAPDRGRVGVVPISRDPVWNNVGHRLGGTKECLCGSEIAMLAQHHIHQVTIAINGPVQVAPLAVDLDERLVHVPASTDATPATVAEFFSQRRREFGFPVPHGSVSARAEGGCSGWRALRPTVAYRPSRGRTRM